MNVQIRLFAIMAQQARTGHLTLDLPSDASVQEVRTALEKRFPHMPWPAGALVAVNQEYAAPETRLRPGDEVAVIPPVSGGAGALLPLYPTEQWHE